jgi:hypothetical protein
MKAWTFAIQPGYIAAPYGDVSVNGKYIPGMSGEGVGYCGNLAVIGPDGRALVDEYGRRPQLYRTLNDAAEDVDTIIKYKGEQP